MYSRKPVFTLLLLLVLVAVPPVDGQVVPQQWQDSLEAYLRQVDANTTTEIVVFVLDSLWGHSILKEGSEIHDIAQLGVYIFNEMPLVTPNGTVIGIGKKGKDNGVLVLVAIEEREWRIEVGYGLEGDITDIESSHIAQQHLIPKFQEGDYGAGLYDTVVALAEKIPPPSETGDLPVRGRYFYENVSNEETPLWLVFVLVAVLVGVVVLFIVLGVLVKKGKIKMKRINGGGYGGSGGGTRGGGGKKGGGGRSGGGGSKGKW